MERHDYEMGDIDIAWCPGCGNFGILNALKGALTEMEIDPERLVMVSGIGQAAKIPHYMKCNVFNGLHGRALPAAVAIKAVNPRLIVIAESGDGDMYGEGGNHFLSTIRRNPDITNIVHNNMVYGLTKGQAAPTSQRGFVTPVQVAGVILEPFNPIAVAVALDASFVARAFIGDIDMTKEIIKKALAHRGYALVDIFQPCVSFNKINTYKWFKDHTYYLEDSYDPTDRSRAFEKAIDPTKFPLGVIYTNPKKTMFEGNLTPYVEDNTPIIKRERDLKKLQKLIDKRRKQ
ncbi:MAG: 2-oxoacid ferredoxin oxidoreductase [Deltaproteobacteria bacterium]|nr:2-oxoacid ferredoxin oxidoreductase [Deltaproteobacteria bacterium]